MLHTRVDGTFDLTMSEVICGVLLSVACEMEVLK
jgi:hypothetical protein